MNQTSHFSSKNIIIKYLILTENIVHKYGTVLSLYTNNVTQIKMRATHQKVNRKKAKVVLFRRHLAILDGSDEVGIQLAARLSERVETVVLQVRQRRGGSHAGHRCTPNNLKNVTFKRLIQRRK